MPERTSTGGAAHGAAQAACVRAAVPICLAALTFVGSLTGRVGMPLSAASSDEVPSTIEIPMELLFSRPLVRGTINGEGPFALLIDPHQSTARIRRSLAEALALLQDGEASRVEVGFAEAPPHGVDVEIRDIASLVPELGAAAVPDAVLDLEVWSGRLVTFDYRRWQVRIEPGELPEPDGREVFNLDPVSRELRVPLTVGDRVITCRVDLWFPGGVALPLSYLTELPLASEPTDTTLAATRAGLVAARKARVAEPITVAEIEHASRLVLFGNVGETGIVGYGWLSRLSITYDAAHNRARLTVGPPDTANETLGDEGTVNLR